jgi:hypothetical protein
LAAILGVHAGVHAQLLVFLAGFSRVLQLDELCRVPIIDVLVLLLGFLAHAITTRFRLLYSA